MSGRHARALVDAERTRLRCLRDSTSAVRCSQNKLSCKVGLKHKSTTELGSVCFRIASCNLLGELRLRS